MILAQLICGFLIRRLVLEVALGKSQPSLGLMMRLRPNPTPKLPKQLKSDLVQEAWEELSIQMMSGLEHAAEVAKS